MSKDFKSILEGRRGYEEVAKKEVEHEERQKNYVNRFWLPPETSAKIIFLDDNPPIIEEHQLKLNGDWKNWFTCLRMLGEPCPLCDTLQDNPYTVGFYTIIDTTSWTDKNGKEHKNERKLFAAKFKTLQQLKRLSAKRGNLAGCVFDVYRGTKDDPNTGNQFDFEGRLEKEQVKALNEDITPFDYATLIAPKSMAELRALLNKNSESTASDLSDYGDSDDVDSVRW